MLLLSKGKGKYFLFNEGDFSLFKIFSYPLAPPPIYEPITIHTTSRKPIIKVGSIDVIAVSSSAFLHIGSTEHVQLETRVLHIRQIETVDEPKRPVLKRRRNKECPHLLVPFKL